MQVGLADMPKPKDLLGLYARPMSGFGERLRAAREARGLSRDELSIKLHGGPGYVTPYQIGRYERGPTRNPSIDTAEAPAQALSVDLRWLLLGETVNPPTVVITDPELLSALAEAERILRRRLSSDVREMLLAMWPASFSHLRPNPLFFVHALQAIEQGTFERGNNSNHA